MRDHAEDEDGVGGVCVGGEFNCGHQFKWGGEGGLLASCWERKAMCEKYCAEAQMHFVSSENTV